MGRKSFEIFGCNEPNCERGLHLIHLNGLRNLRKWTCLLCMLSHWILPIFLLQKHSDLSKLKPVLHDHKVNLSAFCREDIFAEHLYLQDLKRSDFPKSCNITLVRHFLSDILSILNKYVTLQYLEYGTGYIFWKWGLNRFRKKKQETHGDWYTSLEWTMVSLLNLKYLW